MYKRGRGRGRERKAGISWYKSQSTIALVTKAGEHAPEGGVE